MPKASNLGLVPNQPSGNRSGVDIEGPYIRGAPCLSRWDEARKAGVPITGAVPAYLADLFGLAALLGWFLLRAS